MKKFYTSKVLWVNFISFIAIIIQVVTGQAFFTPEYQALALTIINTALRFVTVVPVAPLTAPKIVE